MNEFIKKNLIANPGEAFLFTTNLSFGSLIAYNDISLKGGNLGFSTNCGAFRISF